MGTHDQIPSDPAISKHESINKDMHPIDLRLDVREILGPPPLSDPSHQPPGHQPEVEEKMVTPVAKQPTSGDTQPPQPQAQNKSKPRPAAAAGRHGSCVSTPLGRSSDPCLSATTTTPLLHMLPTARALHHEIAAPPRCRCMPPLPSVVWRGGRRLRRRCQRPIPYSSQHNI
jgi:hypothetical protein